MQDLYECLDLIFSEILCFVDNHSDSECESESVMDSATYNSSPNYDSDKETIRIPKTFSFDTNESKTTDYFSVDSDSDVEVYASEPKIEVVIDKHEQYLDEYDIL